MYKPVSLLLLFIPLANTVVFAQNNNSDPQKDFELWTRAGLSREFLTNFELEVETGYRIDENLTRTKKVFGDICVTYKTVKWLHFKVKYRFSSVQDDFEHRLNMDALVRKDINRFKIRLRNRIQREWISDKNPRDFLRERLKLSYDIRNCPVEPFISCEVFYRFNTDENEFRKTWTDFGMEWNINKKNAVELFLRLSRELNVKNPLHSKIVGLEFHHNLD